VPATSLGDAVIAGIGAEFEREYERLFGSGTAYTDAGVELVGLGVEVRLPLEIDVPARPDQSERHASGERRAWFGGREVVCATWDGDAIAPDVVVEGPAFIELATTTVVVYPGQCASVDAIGNVRLQLEPGAAR
jgi:N-methylhydantoinase A